MPEEGVLVGQVVVASLITEEGIVSARNVGKAGVSAEEGVKTTGLIGHPSLPPEERVPAARGV